MEYSDAEFGGLFDDWVNLRVGRGSLVVRDTPEAFFGYGCFRWVYYIFGVWSGIDFSVSAWGESVGGDLHYRQCRGGINSCLGWGEDCFRSVPLVRVVGGATDRGRGGWSFCRNGGGWRRKLQQLEVVR